MSWVYLYKSGIFRSPVVFNSLCKCSRETFPKILKTFQRCYSIFRKDQWLHLFKYVQSKTYPCFISHWAKLFCEGFLKWNFTCDLTSAAQKDQGQCVRTALPALSSDHRTNGKSRRQPVIMSHQITLYCTASPFLFCSWLSAGLSVNCEAF